MQRGEDDRGEADLEAQRDDLDELRIALGDQACRLHGRVDEAVHAVSFPALVKYAIFCIIFALSIGAAIIAAGPTMTNM